MYTKLYILLFSAMALDGLWTYNRTQTSTNIFFEEARMLEWNKEMFKFWKERPLMVNRDQVSRFHHQESLPGAERESGIRISSQISDRQMCARWAEKQNWRRGFEFQEQIFGRRSTRFPLQSPLQESRPLNSKTGSLFFRTWFLKYHKLKFCHYFTITTHT